MKRHGAGAVALMVVVMLAGNAGAVPSYARQTGWECAQCHTVYPELTPAGRRFKLDGYSTGQDNKDASAAIAALVQVGDTFQKSQPATAAPGDGSDNSGRVRMPEHFSLFYAGAIAPHLGAFTELAYEAKEGKLGMDMLDLRYAHSLNVAGKDLTLGLVATNMPTVQDPWNTGPAWGFPFTTSPDVPQPEADPILSGMEGLGGLGAYLSFNDVVYAEASAYRSAHQGDPEAMDTYLQGYAPYWRVALSQDLGPVSAEIGGFGLRTRAYPLALAPTGPKDRVHDVAEDFQIQYIGNVHIVTVRGLLVQESGHPEASFDAGMATDASTSLKKANVSVSYAYNRMLVGSIGYLALTGSGKSGGMVYVVDYLPWPSAKLSAQATVWAKFEGATGGAARDNDALALMGQVTF